MTFQKSLKLTALGLGIASIALTGCKNNSNDGTNGINGKDGKAGKTDPNAININNLLDKVKIEIPNADGSKTIQEYDMSKGKIEIVTEGTEFPSNYCMPFSVKYINNSGAVESLDISALYDKLDGSHNSDVQVVLDSKSQLKFEIVENTVCPKGLLDKNGDLELDKNPTKTTNAISRHSLVKLGDKATVLVRYKNAKSLAEKTFTVVDSQINFIHTKSNHVMAEGLASKPFKIYGVLVGRDGKISDNRTGNHHSHNDKLASELFKQLGGKTDKLTEESVKKLPVLELTGSTTDVSLVDAKGNSISISYDTKLEGWVIDGKNIPISADYKAYTLKVIPKDTVKLDIPSLEIKIKKIAAVVQSYELVGFNSNLLGRKPFDIKAKFSDGTVKSIFDVKKGEKSPFNIKYKINNLKQNANNHAINIYNDIESTVGLINANNNSDIPVYLENKVGTYPRYIDVNGTQEFSAAYNHLYELDIEVTYTPNYIASGLNSLTPSQQLKVINSGDSEEDAWVNSVVNLLFLTKHQHSN